MQAEELKALTEINPFKPFRLNLTDGRNIDVTHPDQLLIAKSSALIGLNPDAKGFVDGWTIVYLPHVVSVERQAA